MGVVRAAEAVHRGHGAAVGLAGERQAAIHGLAVEQHGTGAAIALLAAALDLDMTEPAQDLEERAVRGDGDRFRPAVHMKGQVLLRMAISASLPFRRVVASRAAHVTQLPSLPQQAPGQYV